MAKAIKRVESSGAFARGDKWPLNMSADLLAAMHHAQNSDNSEPEELFGLDGPGQKRDDVSFHELIREDDPAVMDIAEDMLLERGWKLREVTGGMHAKHFTIELKPMWGPKGEWKMVQAHVHEPELPTVISQHRSEAAAQRALKRAPADAEIIHEPETARTHERWLVARKDLKISLDVANGSVRTHRTFGIAIKDPAELRKRAVADAWAIAKAIKTLPITATEAEVDAIVDRVFTQPDNVKHKEELYGATNIVDGKRHAGDEAALVRSGARQVPCKSGLDRKQLATCWTHKPSGIGALGEPKIGDVFKRNGSKTKWIVDAIVKPARTVGTLRVGETIRVVNGDEAIEITNAQGAWIDGQGRRWGLGSGLDGARRRPEMETRTTDDGPGSGPPSYGELHIGREKADGYKDLPWKRVIAEAKKERAKNPDGGANLRLTLRVTHAPDAHTPPTWVDWDPFDDKGAIAFAKKLIDDGAMYADVRAKAERPYMQGDRRPPKGAWTLASFESDAIDPD